MPYRVLEPHWVTMTPASGWSARYHDGAMDSVVLADGDVLPGWDAARHAELGRTFTFPEDIRALLGVPDETRLHVVVSVATAGGIVRDRRFAGEIALSRPVVDVMVR